MNLKSLSWNSSQQWPRNRIDTRTLIRKIGLERQRVFLSNMVAVQPRIVTQALTFVFILCARPHACACACACVKERGQYTVYGIRYDELPGDIN